MNKATLASVIILSFLTPFYLSACGIPAKGHPKVWTVKKSGTADFRTIQQAVDNASNGDTILVYDGTYYENVVVDKSLSIVAKDKDNTIIDSNGTGNVVFINRTTDVTIKNFTIRGSGSAFDYSGVFLFVSDRIHISDNVILNHFYGIRVRGYSFDNVVSDNMVANNENGITFESCFRSVISGNNITDNFWGVVFLGSNENEIIGNMILSSAVEGIVFVNSRNNIISGNDIIENDPGISFYISIENFIYQNNFDNTVQVEFVDGNDTGVNYWDNGIEGNYWSDYTGADSDRDGIGNTPYFINEDSVDNYPLMGVLSVFYIVSGVETYRVKTICNLTISDFEFRVGSETGNRIIQFNVAAEETKAGFCRVMIPTDLMEEPYIVLVGKAEINSDPIEISNDTHVYLYLDHIYGTVSIISSRMWQLYQELTDEISSLRENMLLLNKTYNSLQSDSSQLQMDYLELNGSYYDFLADYEVLLSNWTQLQMDYLELNGSYYDFLADYEVLLSNWTQLQSDHFEEARNTENLTYTFASMTAIFLIVTVYLSKHAHFNKRETSVDGEKSRSTAQ